MSKRVSVVEEKMRHHDRELQTDPPSGTYKLEHDDAHGGEELEKIAMSSEPFRELSCNSNIRTSLTPKDDREILRKIVIYTGSERLFPQFLVKVI